MMKRFSWRTSVVAVVAVVALGACGGPRHHSRAPGADLPSARAEAAPHRLKLLSFAGPSANFDKAALQALPSAAQTVGTLVYSGASLWALLEAAGVTADPRVKDKRLSLYLVVTGSDGYSALLSWAEIDPEFGNRQVLVAYRVDGAALANGEALRLIVPGDAKRGRSVRDVTRIEVFFAPSL